MINEICDKLDESDYEIRNDITNIEVKSETLYVKSKTCQVK